MGNERGLHEMCVGLVWTNVSLIRSYPNFGAIMILKIAILAFKTAVADNLAAAFARAVPFLT